MREQDSSLFYRAIGHDCFGPLVFDFCRWIHQRVAENSIDTVVFAARDGYVFKKAYEILYPNESANAKYIYVSRASTLPVRVLESETTEDFLNSLSLRKYTSPQFLVSRLHFDGELWRGVASDLNINYSLSVPKRWYYENPSYYAFCELAAEQYYLQASEQRDLLIEYLCQEAIAGKVGLVDSGWNGSTQSAILALSDELSLNHCKGLYLMANYSDKQARNGMDIEGFIFDEMQPRRHYQEAMAMQGLVDFFSSQKCGSTVGYNKDKKTGHIEPILDEYEFNTGSEYEVMGLILSEMHLGCIAYVSAAVGGCKEAAPVCRDKATAALLRVAKNPTKEELSRLGRLAFSEGEIHTLACPSSVKHYVCNPKEFLLDFNSSTWKLGFLCSVIGNNVIANKIYNRLLLIK